MFSRRGRKKDFPFFSKKEILFLTILIICLVLFLFLSFYVAQKLHVKTSLEKDVISFTNKNERVIFTLDKIFLFSSCDATNNSTSKALWDLNIMQYTDIAIYLNNHSDKGLTLENTIEKLWIDNLSFGTSPELGTPSLYYKNIDLFGKVTPKEENKIENRLDYTVSTASYALDTNEPNVYNTGQTPITLEYVNQNIKTNAIIGDTSSLIFDGSLLKKANIPLQSIQASISFQIHIQNGLAEEFVCPISFNIPLENEQTGETIINGNIKQVLEELHSYQFYKL